MKTVIFIIALMSFAPRAWCQCTDEGDTANVSDGFIREDGNTLFSYAEGWITGGFDEWDIYVDAAIYQNASALHSGDDDESTDAYVDWTDTLQTVGPGTFTEYAEFDFTDEDDSSCDADYSDDTQNILVQRPTISGFFSSNAFWNLGPGSPDPAPTSGSNYYYQSVALTFNTNCSPDDSCSDTPSWSLTTSSNQTTLGTKGASPVTTASGSTVTISKSSSYGNCSYVSDLTANLDGFSSSDYYVAVDSPVSQSHTTEATAAYSDGYSTSWRFSVLDACGVNDLTKVQMSEDFPSGFSADNGSSNYADPEIVNFELGDWPSNTEFIDNIGQCCNSQSPSVYFDDSAPPYTGNTRYLHGAHTFNAGTDVTGDGIPVYSGTIEYYADHGDNTP